MGLQSWAEGVRPDMVAPLLAPLWDLGPLPVRCGGAPTPQAWVCAPQHRTLLVEGWDDLAEGSGGHQVGVTRNGTSCGATGPWPCPQTRMQWPARCCTRSPGCMPCGVRYCLPQGSPSFTRNTSTPARGRKPPRRRGLPPASSCGRGGCAAGCRSSFTRPDPGVQAPGRRPQAP